MWVTVFRRPLAVYVVRFPARPLQLFIECFWFLRTEVSPPQQLEEHIFTDGRADIVLSFGSPYLRSRAGREDHAQLVRSNLDAQRRYPVNIIQQGQIDLIGVRFRPGGLAAFVRVPVGELDGLTLGLRDVFGQAGDDLEQRLYEAAGRHDLQVRLLNGFFMGMLEVPEEHELVAHVAATIERQRGQVSVHGLGDMYGYSIRTLDRQFRQVMGFPPKFYARTVRFRHALNCLVHDPAVEWVDIVATCGYYDQPHFIKEFVEFTGTQPEAYRARLWDDGVPSAPNYVQFLQDNPEQMS
jgi:AraC-like DNA-binding protein